MVKRLLLFTIALVFFQISEVFSQITIDAVAPGPYTPGSSIAATFTIQSTCINRDNRFDLVLVSPSGVELGTIGSYTGFYTTFINGTIPPGTLPGTGYKLRIKTTSPVLTTIAESNTFEIKVGTAITAAVSSAPVIAAPYIFGYCPGRPNAVFFFTNQSTATSTVTGTIKNELSGSIDASLTFTTAPQPFTASLAHYTVSVKAQMPDGTIATRAYMVINNNVFNNFSTSGSNAFVCLPGGFLQYGVDVNGPTGIQNNYPGNTYQILWGDGVTDTYTFCDLKSGFVRHEYLRSSCGNPPYVTGGITAYNVFGINISVASPCGQVGGAISTYVRVVDKPENRFSHPRVACTGKPVTFFNNSLLGQDPGSNSPSCTDNTVTYNWYIDGQIVLAGVPRSTNLIHTFPTHKVYNVTLESVTSGSCEGASVTQQICIQDPPRPAFDFNGASQTGCAPFTIQARDLSYVDEICDANNIYNWIVTGPSGVQITNQGDKNPTFTFNNPGTYEIILEIQTASCGAVRTTTPQQIILADGAPVATLSADATLCALNTLTFDNNAGPTRTILTGTQQNLATTYTWSVTESDGSALAPGDFSFEGGTDLHTKFPIIKFNQFKTYRIKVVHVNSCGQTDDFQLITFSPSPVPNVVANANPICYDGVINLQGSITGGAYSSFEWVGNGGNFSPATGNLTTVYTPSLAERNAGTTTIILRVNTGLQGACAKVEFPLVVNIRPNNTGTNATQQICTGNAVSHTPVSTVAGSTYSWTVSNPDGNATGQLAGSGTAIKDVIINNSATANAVVIYTITPLSNGCSGTPYTFTVTITPRPILAATAARSTICSNESSAITLSSNLLNTRYTWTSSVIGSITGNNSVNAQTTSTIIDDILINNGTTQGSVTYIITPFSATGCAGTPFPITVNVDPAVTPATAGASVTICNATTYRLDGNQPKSNETGTWELTSGQTGVAFSDTDLHSPNAIANGLVPGIPYVFKWTISAPGVCAVSSALVTITVIPPTVPGTIDGAQTVCAINNNGAINLTGNIGDVVRWESSTDGGTTWQQIANTTTTLTYLNLTTSTQYRAIVRNGNCDEKPTNITIITVTPAGTQANAGSPQTICGETTVKLDGNPVASGETGVWSVVAGSPPVHIVDPSDPKTEVQNLITGQSYTFTWTITGTSACGPSPSNVTVNVLPLIDKNTISSSSTVVCSGQTITLTGSQPIGGDGTYHYLWEVSTDAGATWTTTGGDTRDLSFTITLPTQFRRTVISSTCTKKSIELSIDALPPIRNNSISADQAICTNEAAVRLTGTPPQGAGGGFNYEWEFSIDGGLTWTSTNTFQPDYLPVGLTQTTQYRRIVSTITCNGDQKSISNIVTITIKPDAIAKFTFVKDKDCAPFQITAANITAEDHPVENATYTWYAGTDLIGTGINFPGHLISNSNETVVIKLVVSPRVGCNPAEFSWTFSTNQAVPASFGLSETVICGPKLVAFTNTSLQGTGATFSWKVGNTQISTNANPPPYNFQPDPSGKDTTYVITLYSITSCGIDSAKGTVLVKSPPRPIFSPQTTLGCSPLPVQFNNNSPLQSDIEYFFDFGDGSPIVRTTDRSPVTHEYTTTNIIRTYNATLTAKNQCGTVTTTPYSIVVRPNTVNAELVVNGNQLKGCAPYTVTFDNNSTGANRFFVDFKDGTAVRPSINSPERFAHTFTTPGSYDVTLTATNGCSTSTKTVTIIVDPQPLAAFDAVNKLGCTGLEVKFINNTQNGMSYLWDFGDGSPTSTETEPTHTYTGTQEYYTVTLTATNGLGCPMTVSQNNFIRIVQPPVAAFNVDPSTLISIPDYTFRFQDQSANNPTIWEWDFGDGTGSALKNPSHTYLDTGTYKVTLKTINQQGCFTTTFKNVTIKGVPGYLFVPNSFVPGSTQPELREFRAKGSGLQTWRFSVFNKWGQLLWESTKLDEGRPAEGWDGTFKGQQMPQGVYYWKIDVQMVNGSEWKGMTYDKSVPKRTGAIHLIR